MLPLAVEYPLLNIIWTMFVFFGFVLWISLIFRAFGDLFGRDDVSGWGKAGWSLLIILLPLFGVLMYLLSQGTGMAERQAAAAKRAQGEFDDYVRGVAEFGRLKASALA